MEETKQLTVTVEEYEMILEALRYTKYVKFLNDEAKSEYRRLGIKLGDTED